MSRFRRLLAPTLAAGAVLVLTACGTSTTDPEPTPTETDPQASTTAWADDVCTSLADVRAAVTGIGDGLSINPLDGGSLDAAREQIRGQVDEVGTAVGDLRATVRNAPDEPGAQEARAALEEPLDDLDAAQQQVVTQARAAADAASVPEFLTAAGGALTSVRTAVSAVGEVFSVATSGASGVRAEVRADFEAAPACQQFRS